MELCVTLQLATLPNTAVAVFSGKHVEIPGNFIPKRETPSVISLSRPGQQGLIGICYDLSCAQWCAHSEGSFRSVREYTS